VRAQLWHLSWLLGAAAWFPPPASAHHALSAEYSPKKPIELIGFVTGVEWANPHAHIYIRVKDKSGKMVNWELELGSPNALAKRGWTSKALKIGDKVTVTAFPARDGSNLVSVRTLRMDDGRVLVGPPDSLFEP